MAGSSAGRGGRNSGRGAAAGGVRGRASSDLRAIRCPGRVPRPAPRPRPVHPDADAALTLEAWYPYALRVQVGYTSRCYSVNIRDDGAGSIQELSSFSVDVTPRDYVAPIPYQFV
jgi:hypothetical protein